MADASATCPPGGGVDIFLTYGDRGDRAPSPVCTKRRGGAAVIGLPIAGGSAWGALTGWGTVSSNGGMPIASRRALLRLGAASLIAAPFQRLLIPRARAATAPARRLLIYFSPNGTIPAQWTPSGSGTSFSFPSGSILEPLAAWRDQLTLVHGMDFYNADNHEGGMAAMLTNNGGADGVTGGMSLDQWAAAYLGTDTRFASLEFGVQTSLWGGSSQTRMSYAGPGSYVTPDDDPLHVYTRLFGEVAGDAESAARLLARRQSILDLAGGELGDLRKRLGTAEQIKLDVHLESLRALERSLAPSDACGAPEPPTIASYNDNDLFPDVLDAQLQLAVLALSCGATRVVSVQASHTVSPTVCSWLGEGEGHHSLSHADDSNTAGVAGFVNCERWFAEQFGVLLQRLQDAPDPETGGSLLDTTAVLWVKEMGDSRAHVCTGVPWVLAGGGGAWPAGRLVDLAGGYHASVLVSICQALGLPNDSFGDPAAGSGPAAELS